MRVLISHTNFPAQFRRLAPALVQRGHEVVFIAKNREWHAPDPVTGLRVITYKTHRSGGSEALHPYLRRFEAGVLEGQAVYRVCQQLREEGWIPDWILNHVGFGNGLYLSDAFPEAKRIGFLSGFIALLVPMWIFLGNLQLSRIGLYVYALGMLRFCLSSQTVILVLCQLSGSFSSFPRIWSKLQVIHEGIDVEALVSLERGRVKDHMFYRRILRSKCSLM